MKPLHPPLQLVIEVTERLHWLDHAMRKLLMERRSTETAEHRAKIRRRHADLCDKLAETRKHVDENGAKGWQHFGENSGNTWLLWLLQHAPELADVASKLKTAKALKSREAEHLQQQLATLTTQFADVIKAVRALSPIRQNGRSTAPPVWFHR